MNPISRTNFQLSCFLCIVLILYRCAKQWQSVFLYSNNSEGSHKSEQLEDFLYMHLIIDSVQEWRLQSDADFPGSNQGIIYLCVPTGQLIWQMIFIRSVMWSHQESRSLCCGFQHADRVYVFIVLWCPGAVWCRCSWYSPDSQVPVLLDFLVVQVCPLDNRVCLISTKYSHHRGLP